jgi:hypothetical protein
MRNTPRTLEAIKADVQRFADWYRSNKPRNDVIRLSADDVKQLIKSKDIAKHYGFVFATDSVSFGKFTLALPLEEESARAQKRTQTDLESAISIDPVG